MAEEMDYASSGVDITLEGEAVGALIGALGKFSRPSGTLGSPVEVPGGFGGLIQFKDDYLALATDGVGSKLQIASTMNAWHGVGIDCMAMNVNDLLCVGAEPIAFVDYIAVPKPDPEVHAVIGQSLAEACRRARVTLAGGETASLPGIVSELDLSGTALGWVEKGQEITGEALKNGDVLIGLPSSGIHSNGYSLVRKILDENQIGYEQIMPVKINGVTRIERFKQGELTVGEVLLNPTSIYCSPIVEMIQSANDERGFNRDAIHGIAHITGGGLSNLLRLHQTLGWEISDPLPVHEEFSWLQKLGNVSAKEMYRTFNMGCGMIIAVEAKFAQAIVSWLQKKSPGSEIIGHVRNHGRIVTHAIESVYFDEY